MQISQLLKEPGALIIDVRTPAEFMGGHVNGSINIPLSDVPNRLDDFRNDGKPVVLCCASGNRSGQATYFLQNQGFDNIFNGGSWLDVNYFMSN